MTFRCSFKSIAYQEYLKKKKDFFTLPKYVQFVFKRQDSNLTENVGV